MEYKKIEQLVYNNNLISRENYSNKKEYDLEVDKMLFTNLKKCIDKNITLEMDENDFVNIYKTYLKLRKNNVDININTIFDIANLSKKKIDFLGIIQEITE